MKSVRHVLFDFDGVICDSLDTAIEAFNSIRAEHYPQLPEVEGKEGMTEVYAGSLRTCLHKWLSPEDARRFFDLHSAHMSSVAHTLSTFPGIGHVLSSLGSQAFSIVTSAYSEAVRAVLSSDPDYNDGALYEIAGRELRQPKTEKIQAILAGLGVSSEDAVYVGDLESDILYCRDVPIDIIAVGYGYHPSSYLADKSPTHLVDSVEGLGTLLMQMLTK